MSLGGLIRLVLLWQFTGDKCLLDHAKDNLARWKEDLGAPRAGGGADARVQPVVYDAISDIRRGQA